MEFYPNSTVGHILCCECGISIPPNPSNTCVDCLRSRVDISEGIPKHSNLISCRNCERYLSPPTAWIKATLESRELLAVCLKKVKPSLAKVRLIDASFIWTEPHSKRVKMKLTIQKQVEGGTFLQQTFIVEFVINNQMCPDCHRVEAKDYWTSVVQVRQKVAHKKTFFYLEQIILKHKMHATCSSISQKPTGLDFFYSAKQDARKFTDFLLNMLPCKYQTAQQLVSHDIHSNIYNYKTTFSVEIPPICKHDIVCLPKSVAQQFGSMNQIAICLRVTQCINLIDFTTLQTCEISGTAYWRHPFHAVSSSKNFVEFTVMDIERIDNRVKSGSISNKHLLADCWVVKSSELGINENYTHTRTHMGHLLRPGDTVLGYDVRNSNLSNEEMDGMRDSKIPDVILVRKVFSNSLRRKRKRNWKLQRIRKETGTTDEESYMGFLEDLEEDKDLRQNVDIYVDRSHVPASDTDEDTPHVTLQEMLEDLKLEDPVEVEMENAES